MYWVYLYIATRFVCGEIFNERFRLNRKFTGKYMGDKFWKKDTLIWQKNWEGLFFITSLRMCETENIQLR